MNIIHAFHRRRHRRSLIDGDLSLISGRVASVRGLDIDARRLHGEVNHPCLCHAIAAGSAGPAQGQLQRISWTATLSLNINSGRFIRGCSSSGAPPVHLWRCLATMPSRAYMADASLHAIVAVRLHRAHHSSLWQPGASEAQQSGLVDCWEPGLRWTHTVQPSAVDIPGAVQPPIFKGGPPSQRVTIHIFDLDSHFI